MNATIQQTSVDRTRQFPPFSLSRLLTTVFNPQPGERVCILIDLEDPRGVKDFGFLKNPDLSIQRLPREFTNQEFHRGDRSIHQVECPAFHRREFLRQHRRGPGEHARARVVPIDDDIDP